MVVVKMRAGLPDVPVKVLVHATGTIFLAGFGESPGFMPERTCPMTMGMQSPWSVVSS